MQGRNQDELCTCTILRKRIKRWTEEGGREREDKGKMCYVHAPSSHEGYKHQTRLMKETI